MAPLFIEQMYPGWMIITPGLAWATLIACVCAVIFSLWIGLWLLAHKKKKSTPTPNKPSPSKMSDPVDYDRLIQKIQKLNGKGRHLLFAANSFKDLPVTVPVHAAVRLAETKKCLLVDLDTTRNAVAQVFGLDTDRMQPHMKVRSFQTEFENLYVWPARNFQLLKHMNLRQLIENASEQYDHILVYAPYLTTLPDRRQIASACKRAFAFPGPKDERLKPLLKACNCTIVQEF